MSSAPSRSARAADAADALDRFALRDQPGYLIRLAQQRAVELFVRECGEDGPTPPQFGALAAIAQNPGLNQTDLVSLTGIDRSTLTEVLGRLAGRGLVRRERSPKDQRTNALYLTEDGRRVLSGIFDAALRAQTRILEPVPPERRDEAVTLLRLLAGLDAQGDG